MKYFSEFKKAGVNYKIFEIAISGVGKYYHPDRRGHKRLALPRETDGWPSEDLIAANFPSQADTPLMVIARSQKEKNPGVAILTSYRCGDFQHGSRNYFIFVRTGEVGKLKSKTLLWIDDHRRNVMGGPFIYGHLIVADPAWHFKLAIAAEMKGIELQPFEDRVYQLSLKPQ